MEEIPINTFFGVNRHGKSKLANKRLELAAWNNLFLEKLVAAWVAGNLAPFMEQEFSLPCSEQLKRAAV
jgi:hypothetical protein